MKTRREFKVVESIIYEGKCPICGAYQEANLEEYVDTVCIKCLPELLRKNPKKHFLDGGTVIVGTDGNIYAVLPNGEEYMIGDSEFVSKNKKSFNSIPSLYIQPKVIKALEETKNDR